MKVRTTPALLSICAALLAALLVINLDREVEAQANLRADSLWPYVTGVAANHGGGRWFVTRSWSDGLVEIRVLGAEAHPYLTEILEPDELGWFPVTD